jgi:glutathione-independent formaldehyde dehydrogenase
MQSRACCSSAIGKAFEQGLSFGTGQCNVKQYNRQLRDLILSGRAQPSFVVWFCIL